MSHSPIFSKFTRPEISPSTKGYKHYINTLKWRPLQPCPDYRTLRRLRYPVLGPPKRGGLHWTFAPRSPRWLAELLACSSSLVRTRDSSNRSASDNSRAAGSPPAEGSSCSAVETDPPVGPQFFPGGSSSRSAPCSPDHKFSVKSYIRCSIELFVDNIYLANPLLLVILCQVNSAE